MFRRIPPARGSWYVYAWHFNRLPPPTAGGSEWERRHAGHGNEAAPPQPGTKEQTTRKNRKEAPVSYTHLTLPTTPYV